MYKGIEQARYSCALGAQQTVLAIKRAVPILHSGPGCGDHVDGLLGQASGVYSGSVPCTNANESDVVFGGIDKLTKVIEGSFQVIDADLFVVLTGCTSDIVGDDIESTVQEYQDEDKPIVYLETGGFKSDNFVSHENVMNAIIDQYVDKYKKNTEVQKGLVNVFSSIPTQNVFWKGDTREIKQLLTRLGFKVNILFGPESGGMKEWKMIPNAEFNIIINSWVGVETAKNLEKKYGTPYFHFPYLPIGALATSKFIQEFGAFAGISKEKIENFVNEEEEIYFDALHNIVGFLLQMRFMLPEIFYTIADSSLVIGINQFLINELGLNPAKQYIIDTPPEFYIKQIENQIKEISKKKQIDFKFSGDGGKAQEEITLDRNQKNEFDLYTFSGDESKNHSSRIGLIFGSAWEKTLSEDLNLEFITVAPPAFYRTILNTSYFGYNGGLRLIEDIYNKVLQKFS